MKVELTIPTSLMEIPLKNYQKFLNISDNNTDDLFIAQKLVEIFCGVELKDVVSIKYTDVVGLAEHFEKLFSKKCELIPRFKIGELEYGFVPDIENITFAEYVDAEKYFNNLDEAHKLMAVLYRPIKEERKGKYLIHDYNGSDEFSEVMKFAPLEVYLGVKVFFCQLYNECMKVLATYLEQEARKMSTHLKHNSEVDGVGINQFISSQKAILQDLTKLQDYHLENALPILHLKNRKQK